MILNNNWLAEKILFRMISKPPSHFCQIGWGHEGGGGDYDDRSKYESTYLDKAGMY